MVTNTNDPIQEHIPSESPTYETTLDPQTSEVLLRLYLTNRLQSQMRWYQARAAEYEINSDKVFRYGALIISATTVLAALGTGNLAEFLATIGISNISAEIRILTAVLPAIAALITSISQLYNWDRQAKLYRDTIMGLERAQLILPTLENVDPVTAQRIYPQLVQQAEAVFAREADQWGQIALGGKEEKAEDPVIAFATQYGLDIFEADGSINTEKLGNLKNILNAAKYTPAAASAALDMRQLEQVQASREPSTDKQPAPDKDAAVAKTGAPNGTATKPKSENGTAEQPISTVPVVESEAELKP